MTEAFLLVRKNPFQLEKDLNEEISEMILLAKTLDYTISNTVIQNKRNIDSSTYFGKGKVETIISQMKEIGVKILFVNDELKPSHYKNIQKICGKKIRLIDRTKLILDIFQNHAKTNESKAQIQLALLEYMLPRLAGKWTHLERQLGGTGIRGGPGEKQIEIDRRLVRKDITKLKRDLNKIAIQRNTQRKSRAEFFKISLVGYTNAGKSSLLKILTGHEAYIKDQLFATLDTTTKKTKIGGDTEVLISDTVGFLRNLPHDLIASFRSTLSDIQESDLIIKVIDISSSDIDGHINTIDETLKFLNCDDKKTLIVFNKIDLIKDNQTFRKINNQYNNPIMVSVAEQLKINRLEEKIYKIVNSNLSLYKLTCSHDKGYIKKEIYKRATKVVEVADYNSIKFKFRCSKEDYNYLKNLK